MLCSTFSAALAPPLACLAFTIATICGNCRSHNWPCCSQNVNQSLSHIYCMFHYLKPAVFVVCYCCPFHIVTPVNIVGCLSRNWQLTKFSFLKYSPAKSKAVLKVRVAQFHRKFQSILSGSLCNYECLEHWFCGGCEWSGHAWCGHIRQPLATPWCSFLSSNIFYTIRQVLLVPSTKYKQTIQEKKDKTKLLMIYMISNALWKCMIAAMSCENVWL